MLHAIAIVGRPNVGKSTLFNCLTQSRSALVSDFPGMTRDRQYGEGEIHGHRFIVIDTGGITDQEGELDTLMGQQSWQAVNEADKIIFLVDVRAGLTPDDMDIAKKLRASKKHVYLTVNKAEGFDPDIAATEFHQLGFGSPHPISAAHHMGITELVDAIFKDIPLEESSLEDEDPGIKLAIVGRPNVGKSTLTNRMLGEERVIVFDQPGTTRDSIFIPMERFDKHYTLIDTAGIRRRGKVFEATEKFSVVKTLQAIEAANVVLFIMDAREGVTEQDLHLLGFVLDNGKALVIAFNKWDGMSLEQREHTKKTLDRRLNFISFARIHFISALHGSGVGNLFDSINEAYTSAFKKLSTNKLTKILQEAIVQHNPPLIRGRRVKLRYAHAGGHNPPRIIVHGNQVTSLPDAYKRYLAHTYQKRLKLMGTPVYIETKNSDNPFREKKNTLTPRQQRSKERLKRHVKKKK